MAGVATPKLAAAVSNAGGLGSLGVGSSNAATARKAIEELQRLTSKPFNVNLFVNDAPQADPQKEDAWLKKLAPLFTEFGAEPPKKLSEIYKSFINDGDMLAVLLETKPKVVSFHFGLPGTSVLSQLRDTGAVLLATATNIDEARAIEDAGLDGIVAQGIEAGGHRGVFSITAPDPALSTMALTRLLVKQTKLPIIAAGGIMDGAGITAALDIGAVAVQLGTAFVSCPESAADDGYRAALTGPGAYHTTLTQLISGRPARSLANRFTALADELGQHSAPDYPIAYDAGKALHAAAKARGEHGFGAQWAGQGAPLSRTLPAAELVETLVREIEVAQQRRAIL